MKKWIQRQKYEVFRALDIVRMVAGSMRLSNLELTEEDEARILYFILHPEEQERMMQEMIDKHTVKEDHKEM